MKEFNPPFSERTLEELIEVSNSSIDHWQQEAIDQAKKELANRKVSITDQERIIKKWNEENEESIRNEKIRLENNKTESYKYWEIVVLFLFAPIIIVKPYLFSDYTLFNLKGYNYFLKFKQRIIIFILSFLSWFFYINYSYNKSEKERLEEIEKVDISDWKKKYGYD